jgi:hypothetical protein
VNPEDDVHVWLGHENDLMRAGALFVIGHQAAQNMQILAREVLMNEQDFHGRINVSLNVL